VKALAPGFICALVLALVACAKPRVEFRGYSDLSGCTEVIDTELANGASFLGGFDSEDPENPGYITELSGEIFDERVRIEIHCDVRGFLSSVHYISAATDPEDTGALFFRFAGELEALFGEPTLIETDISRSLRFVCHSPSPVILDEWRLEAEE
jgi:hypothetical protein